ncbi:hypothetical protein SAMN06273572_102401 [Monaibacterium marinum]|uniref:Uncharacterized protein n=1 Tax=Pontivivens marinum TaxID=1690039 RepID=A0A2C9CR91_9RHOB|nr:hypothetical protein [Monaibacterium marinum]SOH93723.1 hypothetical protein SAMN06273572_102401 [Monaibacterium marinum]
MEKVFAILTHQATAIVAGVYLMCISFAWTFFGYAPTSFIIGTLLWIGGGIVIATVKKILDKAENK